MIESEPTSSSFLLVEMEARQEELLRRLDELNLRIERAVAQSRREHTKCPEERAA